MAASGTALVLLLPSSAGAQIDRARAMEWFREAQTLCDREAGRVWGQSLCGPIVIADPVSREIATSQPAPDAPRPAALGFANAAMQWGDTRWTTLVWPIVNGLPTHQRRRVLLHELFHRVQPQLGLLVPEVQSAHLDSLEGRYWMRLEWRALAAALAAAGSERRDAIGDALAFRSARRALYPGAAAAEQSLEVNEGLAQYTATVAVNESPAEAIADAVGQLRDADLSPSFVRTFAYPSGAAYGLLLDAAAPGWPRRLRPTDDLGSLLGAAVAVERDRAADVAARRYQGVTLRAEEEARQMERVARLTALRRRFADGPVLHVSNGRNSSFVSQGVTSLPGEGLVYPGFRTSAEWGHLEAAEVLVSTDRTLVTLAGPFTIVDHVVKGSDWVLTLADGWRVSAGLRQGDFRIERVR